MLSGKHMSGKFRGAIAKTIVVKQYPGKTVLTAYPRMGDIRPTIKQQQAKAAFAAGVAYARTINSDPQLKALYAAKLPPGSSVFHAALKEYLLQTKANYLNNAYFTGFVLTFTGHVFVINV